MASNPMKYRHLGRTGLLVSELSFGSWVTFAGQVDTKLAYNLMKQAYEAGINFFDNAETYARGKSEEVMGEALQMGIDEGVWARDDLVVSTKIFFGYKDGPNNRGLSRKHIVEGTQAALKRLRLDYVDLVFCHRPDPRTPIEETVRAMHHVIERGWAFYWGTSEWSAQQITEAMRIADKLGLHRPVMDQPQYNMLIRDRVEREYLPVYKEFGYGLTTWSPLATGILTGKYSGMKVPEVCRKNAVVQMNTSLRSFRQALPSGSRLAQESFQWLKEAKFTKNAWQIERADAIKPVADELGCSMAQLAIAWCLKNKHILGATSSQQLSENLKALDVVDRLTPKIMERLDGLLETAPTPDDVTAMVQNYRTLYPVRD